MNNRSHGMPCPIDGTPLVMSERQGIEIDYCPNCRGVWLDRGELDKLVERSASNRPEPVGEPYGRAPWSSGDYKHKRRKSFLEELFD